MDDPAQAREQEWQPMHRSMRGVVRIFMANSLSSALFESSMISIRWFVSGCFAEGPSVRMTSFPATS